MGTCLNTDVSGTASCDTTSAASLPLNDCFAHTGGCETPFQFTLSRDACLFANYAEELAIVGGADLNIHKLLGVHEQGNMTDLTGFGTPLSSGDQPSFGAIHAFDLECSEWRSLARGDAVMANAYIGYDFGEIKLDNGRNQYSVQSFVQKHITTFVIQQSENPKQRVTKVRVERSIDGITWLGTAIATIPDNDGLNIINIKQSAAVRYWRIRPLAFNGSTTDYWAVRKLELMDYSITNINNIQDEWGFLENRDREYAVCPVTVKGQYDISDGITDLSRFGLELPDITTIKIPFYSLVSVLGRPIVVGDIIEIPSQAEYSVNMVPVKKYVEVTDVSWASDGFTPGWRAIISRIQAAPMVAKQETMDLVGDFVKEKQRFGGAPGFLDTDSLLYAPLSFIGNDKLDSAARSQVPENGSDKQHLGTIDPSAIEAASNVGLDLDKIVTTDAPPAYVRDALPPGGAAYTEGTALPDPTKAKDGTYHRLTYADNLDIPPRLYRFSLKKNKWIYLESDERWVSNLNSTRAARFFNNAAGLNLNEVK